MNEDVKILQPIGLLNAACANKLREKIDTLMEEKYVNILIDCQGVEFMDSMGLSCLIMSLKSLRNAGGSLALTNTNNQIQLLLEVAALEDSFKMSDRMVVIKTTNWRDESVLYLDSL